MSHSLHRAVVVFAFLAGWFAVTGTLVSCRISISEQDAQQKKAERPGEEEVRFQSGDNSLQGTVFWPASSDDDHPAVVILAGSDRSKRGPLRTRLARHFSAHNIVALVYDSPGTGASSGTAQLQNRDERVAEALDAAAFLRAKAGIRADFVGLLGGSEGADIAVMAAAQEPKVTFAIAVSGAMGVSVLDLLRYSAEKKGYGQGLGGQDILKAITFKEVAFVLLSGVDIVEWPLIAARTKRWSDPSWTTLVELAKLRLQGTLTNQQRESLLQSLRQVVQRFSRERWFAIVDPDGTLQRAVKLDAATFFKLLASGRYSRSWNRSLYRDLSGIRCPVLAIWGAEDSFLPPNQSATRLKQFLAESQHLDHQIKIFPNASHYLTSSGPDTEFVPGYLNLMTDWLGSRMPANDPKVR